MDVGLVSSLLLEDRGKVRDRRTQQLQASVSPSTYTQFRQSDNHNHDPNAEYRRPTS